MAKRKDSVALFEVITATRKREEASTGAGSALRTPKWWFKSKTKPAGQKTSDTALADYGTSVTPPAAHVPAQLEGPEQSPATSSSTATAVVQRVQPVGYASAAPERVTIPGEQHADDGTAGTDAFGLDIPSAQGSGVPARRSWLGLRSKRVGIDPNRREVTLRVRYTTAIVVGFALCVAVVLAFMTGRQSRDRAVADPNAVSSESIRRGAVLPGVLEVTEDDNTKPAPDVPDRPEASRDEQGSTDGTANRGKSAGGNVARPPAPPSTPGDVEESAQRTIGLNYVLANSYRDEQDAVAAKKLLDAAGIPCTIEVGMPGFHRYSVVGIKGFPKTSSAEWQRYVQSIKTAGTPSRPFREPAGYRWRGQPSN